MEKPAEELKCAYCGKERPIEELHQDKITYRSRDLRGKACVKTKTNWYCKEDSCALYDQFAHEG